ncbi:ABC transporter ATP-binding protein [Streptomyces sp. NBC_01498]|uniref:ABC transporter ATP-binding protein n=1 Tax=Streptomyces sp. NBC_01498 TaxID=2975870 RepID=UPI002E7BD1E7|nr:ABC transporter ATP-binding protein [Streptomyces sp. NBC_01498]WTL24542.1 ABC transporter ATP-binding protein [Streptomyces sp. NBC_01498]
MAIVEVNGLRKSYGGKPAVDGVGFTVEEGEIFGILGPNGAGKTTTVECVEGLRVPDSGTVRVAGLDPVRDHREVTQLLGAQLQESELQAKLTVREALELYSAFYPKPADWRPLAARLGLEEKLSTRFGKLSGGQKQRLFIALALIGGPRVVVLDELTTGLDPRARRDTWSLIEEIRDSGVTVLLVTHFMEEARRLCDRIAVIDRGKVVALDTPSGLIARSTASTVIAFTPSRPLRDEELSALPGAASVRTESDRIVINGTDETVNAVITLLARHQVTAHQLRVTEATLDDAFLDLTETGPDSAVGTESVTGTGPGTGTGTDPGTGSGTPAGTSSHAPYPEKRV